MQIVTSKGKTFDVNYIGTLILNGNRMMIDIDDDRCFAEIAADFDGLETITKTDAVKPGVKEVYEGFSKLVAMARNAQDGSVRLTLECPVKEEPSDG